MKNEYQMSALFGGLYGVVYGALIAGAYLFAKHRTQDGGLSMFFVLSVIFVVTHLILFPKEVIKGLKNKTVLVRGFFFASTQILIFSAQAHGQTSAALIATTMGTVFGVILGRVFLKEKIAGSALLGAAICFLAVFLNPKLILQTYWGVLGGVFQGTGFALSRKIMVQKISIRSAVSSGFLIGLVISGIALFMDNGMGKLVTLRAKDIGIIFTIVLIVQYSFFHLYKKLDSIRASLLMLTRLPWAMTFEFIFFGKTPLLQQILSGVLIVIGSFLIILEEKFKKIIKANSSGSFF